MVQRQCSLTHFVVLVCLLCPVLAGAQPRLQIQASDQERQTDVYKHFRAYLLKRGWLVSPSHTKPALWIKISRPSDKKVAFTSKDFSKTYKLPKNHGTAQTKAKTLVIMLELFLEQRTDQMAQQPPARVRPIARPMVRRTVRRIVRRKKKRIPKPRPALRKPTRPRPTPRVKVAVKRKKPAPRRRIATTPRLRPRPRAKRVAQVTLSRPFAFRARYQWKLGFAAYSQWGMVYGDPFLGGVALVGYSLTNDWWLQFTGAMSGLLGRPLGALGFQVALTLHWKPVRIGRFIGEIYAGAAFSGYIKQDNELSLFGVGPRAGLKFSIALTPNWFLALSVPFTYYPLRFPESAVNQPFGQWTFGPILGVHWQG